MSALAADSFGQAAMPQWVDTHVHWDAAEFDSDRDAALVRARRAGVVCCLNPAVSALSAVQLQKLTEDSRQRSDWPVILPAYGVHPLYVEQATPEDLIALEQQLIHHRPVAIGEIGLDAFSGAPEQALQQHWFEAQLALAVRYALPVLLHVRYAVEAVIQILKRFEAAGHKVPGGIAHAFNGSDQQAAQLIRMGFLLGFGGSLTYEGSTRIRRLATQLPLTSLVLETDAPDMAPAWLSKARNEPAELPKIAATLAELRGISVAELAMQTRLNVQKLIPVIA